MTFQEPKTSKPFLETLAGKKQPVPPLWLMRQAGRYLPEYRQVRAQAGDFKTMVYTPKLACEVTLQPIRRYGFDAAILFSDILTVPEAMGRHVAFEAGHGPQLEPLEKLSDLDESSTENIFTPVYEAVAAIKKQLLAEGFTHTALIGFAGSPWTVACYMVEGSGSKEFSRTRTMAWQKPDMFAELIDRLTAITIQYLSKQIEAGAECVQLFDSWAGLLPEPQFRRWVIEPTRKIVSALRQSHPHIPVIGFPRQAGLFYIDYIRETGVTAVGLDTQVPLTWAAKNLQTLCPVQGNLDPFVLQAGGDALLTAAADILENLGHAPFVFNLGHGVNKETNPDHVAALVNFIRAPHSARIVSDG